MVIHISGDVLNPRNAGAWFDLNPPMKDQMVGRLGFIFWEEMYPFVIVNMDAAPVQSSSKCGSDFSIERILGDRKDRREESVEVPGWLCCTRYRPPRLPRVPVCRSRRAGRHARVPFTAAQAAALEAAYARAPYLAPPALKALAAALQLRDDRIKIWFQNRRARERREKSTNIAPPEGVTLAPTLTSGFVSNAWIPHANFGITIAQNQHYTNVPRFNGPIKANCPEFPNSQIYKVPYCTDNLEDRSESSHDSGEADEDRPDSPLDIETIED